jgi:hypothetical protein
MAATDPKESFAAPQNRCLNEGPRLPGKAHTSEHLHPMRHNAALAFATLRFTATQETYKHLFFID